MDAMSKSAAEAVPVLERIAGDPNAREDRREQSKEALGKIRGDAAAR